MQNFFSFGNVEVAPGERSLKVAGKSVVLGGRAFDLLVVLLERAGTLITKDDLLDAVWGKTIVEEANLHVQISALRKALGPQAIATIPGRGYRFALPLVQAVVPVGVAAARSAPLAATAPPALIGREQDIEALQQLLAEHRLITIIGPGGIGKTRLAQSALWNVRHRFADGVATVELASITDSALIAGAIATALKVPVGGSDEDVMPALLSAVRPLEVLLLLDNAEHLIGSIAAIADTLVNQASSLTVLVTSQMPLRMPNERVFRLGGLDVPSASRLSSDEALAYGAVALFDERLQAADRRARVDDGNLAAVLDLCRSLDGIALAIELAAARCPVLGVSGVAQRLDERFRVLRVNNRSAPSRQQTLEAAMQWSYELLSPAQQIAFQQLGVFTGTFTLGMAVQVIRVPGMDDVDSIDLIAELVDHSMVAVDPGEPPRYRLLETGRLFARAKLAESGDEALLRARHAVTLRDHFEIAWRDSWILAEDSFVERYEHDIDNLRAAVDEAALHDPQTAIALTGAAVRLWRWLSLHPEAMRRCKVAEALIDDDTPIELQARLFEGMAQLLGEISHSQGRAIARRAVALYQRIGDDRGRYLALAHVAFSYPGVMGKAEEPLAAYAEMRRIEQHTWPASVRLYGSKIEGGIASDAGEIDASRAAFRARLELATACGSQRDVNASLGNLADLALMMGDASEAVRLGRSLLTRLRRRDAATRSIALGNLLHALLADGDLASSRQIASEVLDVMRQLGFMFPMYVSDALALLAAHEGRWHAAAMLIGYADQTYEAQDQTREINEANARRKAEQLTRKGVGEVEFAMLQRDGARLDPTEVCGIAMASI